MKKLFVALGLITSTHAATNAWAQAAEDSGLKLEEIVVTAEYREVSLQKVAISIDVKEGEQLRLEGKQRIDEILKGTPGINIQPSTGAGQVGVVFRGITSFAGDPPGSGIPGSSIPILIDGMAQDRGEQVRGGTLDLARAEIMRGPQSTNIGASAMIGAVSLVTNNPAFEFGATGRLEIGNYNLFSTEGALNTPLTDNTAVRFAASTEKRDGYYRSGAGDSDLTNARIKYRWRASDDLDIVIAAARNRIGGNGVSAGVQLGRGVWVPYAQNPVALNGCAATAPNYTTGGCTPQYSVVYDGSSYRTRSDPWDDGSGKDPWGRKPFYDTTVDQFSSVINWNLHFATLSLLPSYQKTVFEAMTGANSNASQSSIYELFTQKTPQFEARLISATGSKLDWVAGAYYKRSDREALFQNISYPGQGGCSAATTHIQCYSYSYSENRWTTYSVYGNVKYSIIDALRATGGLRYSKDKKTNTTDDRGVFGNAGNAFGPTNGYTFTSFGASWDATNFSAGLEYDLTPDAMLYTRYATGYRPGNVSIVVPLGPEPAPGAARPAHTVAVSPAYEAKQFSVGIKSRFFDGKVQVNAEAFHTTLENQTVSGAVGATLAGATQTVSGNCGQNFPPGLGAPIRVTSALDCAVIASGSGTANEKSTGIDIDVNWLLTPADRLDVAVEYSKAIYTQSPHINGAAYTATAENLLAAAGITTPTATQSANAAALAPLVNSAAAFINGATLENAPKWSGDASYQHAFTLSGGSTLTPRLNVVYKSEYYSGGGGVQQALTAAPPLNLCNSNCAIQPAYAVYNAYTTWSRADGKFSLTGYVKNIRNEVVMTNYADPYVTLDAPRTYGVNLQASF